MLQFHVPKLQAFQIRDVRSRGFVAFWVRFKDQSDKEWPWRSIWMVTYAKSTGIAFSPEEYPTSWLLRGCKGRPAKLLHKNVLYINSVDCTAAMAQMLGYEEISIQFLSWVGLLHYCKLVPGSGTRAAHLALVPGPGIILRQCNWPPQMLTFS